jgi:hypothetical protein
MHIYDNLFYLLELNNIYILFGQLQIFYVIIVEVFIEKIVWVETFGRWDNARYISYDAWYIEAVRFHNKIAREILYCCVNAMASKIP